MSTIRLGDKVKFVNEDMEGVVTMLEGKTAGVTIGDDFEIPVMLNELVKIPESVKRETGISESAKSAGIKLHGGIHLAFERISETLLELWLHNSECDVLLFAYYQMQKENVTLKKSGELQPEKNISLGRFDLEAFGTWPVLVFQGIPANISGKVVPPFTKTLKFSAREFHGAFKQCYFLGKQAYIFRLDEELKNADLEKLLRKDFSEPAAAPVLSLDKKPESVVDLHMEKLHPDPSSLSAAEMLALQMQVFTRSLEMAHVHKMKRIVFIHGIGNHFLKNKIKNHLAQQKTIVREYRDADLLTYGGGATEVDLS